MRSAPQDMVYVLADGAGLFKVGASGWGVARVSCCQSPAHIKRFAVLEVDCFGMSYRVEAAVHRALKRYQYSGANKIRGHSEWFCVGIDDVLEELSSKYCDIVGQRPVYRLACLECGGFGSSVKLNGRCPSCRGRRVVGIRPAEEIRSALEAHVERSVRKGKR